MLPNRRNKNPNPPARTGSQSRANAINFLLFQLQGAKGNISVMHGRLNDEYRKAVQRQASMEELTLIALAKNDAWLAADDLYLRIKKLRNAINEFKKSQAASKLRKRS